MKLLTPFEPGDLVLKNRLVLAPMTRNRSGEDRVPSPLNREYYAQRASAGLLITESTAVSATGVGYVNAPGLYNSAQVAGWRQLTDEVHSAGGLIFVQLFHAGRISHPDLLRGMLPVAPSSIAPAGQVFTETGWQDFVTPHALEVAEIGRIVSDFRAAAAYAREAGFDGVEIHGANGYLLNQFIDDVSNNRQDIYGGSVAGRCRLLFEVMDAVSAIWPKTRIGVRLSPSGLFNSVGDSQSRQTYEYLVRKLSDWSPGYLHLMNPMMPIDAYPEMVPDAVRYYGQFYEGTLIASGGYTQDTGNAVLEKGEADLVAYGKLFIANPDLPERFLAGAELNQPDPGTFYGGDAHGYTDYPFLNNTIIVMKNSPLYLVLLRFAGNSHQAGQWMQDHLNWLDQGFQENIFLLSGSLQPKLGGCILAGQVSRSDLTKRVEEDPFVRQQIVTAEILEITPSRFSEEWMHLMRD